MAVIDPEGLFNGDRLRRCSSVAQLHWPRLFLASDGFARIEINYARIIGRAYPSFNPAPSEAELQAWLQEYAHNSLIFLYVADGQIWGQWDTRKELLPRYKTSADRRSPKPPEPTFAEWKRLHIERNKAFPKCFGNLPESFLHGVGVGVGVGVGKTICASPGGDSRVGALSSIDDPPFETTEPDTLFPVEKSARMKPTKRSSTRDLTPDQERWFAAWWPAYWLHKSKKATREAFRKHVQNEARFLQVMAATRAQASEMLSREESKRPYGSTWLNGERWEDEAGGTQPQQAASGSIYTKWEPPTVVQNG